MALIPLVSLSYPQFEDHLRKGMTIVLPIGAVEEHGPHLPLGTDNYEAMAVLHRAGQKIDFLLAPSLPYGVCTSTANFPGTVYLSFDALRAIIGDLLCSFANRGAKNVAVYSGHAGRNHMAALKTAAGEVVGRFPDIRVKVFSSLDLASLVSLTKRPPEGDIHAGMLETSLMLAIDPSLVGDYRSVPDSVPKWPIFETVPDPENYFPSGVMGFPSLAEAKIGEEILELLSQAVVTVLRDFSKS